MAVTIGKIQAIIELKNRMSGQLQTAMKDTDKFQSSMDKLGQAATRLGGAMTAGITVPLGLIASQSAKTFASFEKEMSGVKAVTGATGTEFGQLEGLAKKMGETTIFTASQSAEAMRAFGLAGFETDEIMSALAPTLNLAAAGSMSMGEAADIAAKVTRGYGIEAEGTAGAMDVLTKAFTTANTDLSELAGAFKMVGPVAKTAGMSFEMTTASLQVMADAGIIGTMAGRQLRRAMLRLVNPPGEAAKALEKLGVATNTADGRMRPFDQIVEELQPHLQDTAAMAEIFGTVAMPGMVAILEKGSDSLREMTAELQNADGTGKRIADTMVDNVAGSFTLLQSAVEGVWLAIGKQLEPLMRSFLRMGTSVAQFISGRVIPAFAGLDPAIQIIVTALAAAAAAAGPLILAFGMLAPALPAIGTALVAVGSALSAPAIAIGALVAIIGVWIARNETAMASVKALGKFFLGLGRTALKVGLMIINGVVWAIQKVLDGVAWLLKKIPGVETAIKGLTGFFDSAGDALLNWGTESENAADAAAEVAPVVEDMDGALGLLGDTLTNDVIPPTEETLENWEKIAKSWREGSIPEAKDMVRALKDLGGVTKLTETESKALNDTLTVAIEKFDALGEAVPQDILDAWLATVTATDATGAMNKWIESNLTPPEDMDIKGWHRYADRWYQNINTVFRDASGKLLTGGFLGGNLVGPPDIGDTGIYSVGAHIGSRLKDGFKDTLTNIPDVIIGAFTGGGGVTGAIKGIGTMLGGQIGSDIMGAMGERMDPKGQATGITGAIAGMMGPIGAAIGALAGPLIGGIIKLFSGQSTQERIQEAVTKHWGRAISDGLSESMARTADELGSDWGGMLMHLSELFEEAGGVMAFGLEDAIGRTRELFVAVVRGVLTTEEASKSFGSSFKAISDAVVDSGEVASKEFLELMALQRQLGLESTEVIKFMGTQSERVFGGLTEMMKGAFGASGEELESFATVAVGAFGTAVEAGIGFVDAARMAEPAISSISAAFEQLDITSDNVAFRHLARWNELILQNDTLVNAVDAFDDVLLGLSVTGGLTAETLRAMGDLGVEQFDRLIQAGFTENEALVMMAPNIFALADAYREMGIPIDENTQHLLDMATAAGQTNPADQVSEWQLVTDAIGRVVDKLDELIEALVGVPTAISEIPDQVVIDIEYAQRYTGNPPPEFDGQDPFWTPSGFQHGGVGNFGSGTLAMLHGPEAVIPLQDGGVPVHISGGDSDEVVAELRALREELELMPVHLRDAMITSE
jgi:TP901 family phage tail tape measure protein